MSEIRRWPMAEVFGWASFYEGRAQRQEQATKDAKNKGKRR